MSDKPSMLYASPFPPLKSGISDYSVCLVKALSEHFDITLYTDDYEIESDDLASFHVVKYGEDSVDFESFKYKVYNIGNQPLYHGYIYESAIAHPGMIILHDYMLYYLFVGYHQNRDDLYSSLYSQIGLDDYLEVKSVVKNSKIKILKQTELASKLALNKEILRSNNLIMVHSDYSRNKVLETGLVKEERIRKINHLALLDSEDTRCEDKKKLFVKFGIPTDALIVASFGYIAGTKLNKEVAQAIKEIAKKTGKRICYVMVGDGDYADCELEDGVVIKTGYSELNEFNSLIEYSDIIVNLRNPSMGETSGAMLRILQMGKTCITNNGGWFSEIPDDCVVKINVLDAKKEIEQTINYLSENEEDRKKYGLKAREYIKEKFSGAVIAEEIKEFISKEV